jgi:hypothetical protein
MADSNNVAGLAIIVSGTVAVASPLLAAIVQARLGRGSHDHERRRAHEAWIRDQRADIYARALGQARECVIEARAAIGDGPPPHTEVEPIELRRLDGEIRIFASTPARLAFAHVYEVETDVMATGTAWSRGQGTIDAARQAVERLVVAIEDFSDIATAEVQQVAP